MARSELPALSMAGENPPGLTLAMQIAAQLPPSADATPGCALDEFADQQQMLAYLYESAWEHLDDVARSLWLATWLFPADMIDRDLVAYACQLSPSEVGRAVEQLERFSLLRIVGTIYKLHNTARWYLHHKVTHTPAIKDRMTTAARRLCTTLVGMPFAAQLVYHLIEIADIVEFTRPEQVRLLRVAWPSIVHQGLWSRWRNPLEIMLQDSDAVALEHLSELHCWLGLTYRWLSRYDQAEQQFLQVLELLKQDGDCHLAAQALAELAVVYRLQGAIEQAETITRQAWQVYNRLHDTAGCQRCILELAQIDLDKGQPTQTLDKLTSVAISARATSLACNAYIASGDLEHAYALAQRTLQLTNGSNPNHARARATLGRVYGAMGQLEVAQKHLALALSLLEQCGDGSGAARTAASLAQVYYLQDRSCEAQALLEDVLDKQRDIGDKLGLSNSLRTMLATCIVLLEAAVAAGDTLKRDELTARIKHFDFELQNLSTSDKDIGGNTLATT